MQGGTSFFKSHILRQLRRPSFYLSVFLCFALSLLLFRLEKGQLFKEHTATSGLAVAVLDNSRDELSRRVISGLEKDSLIRLADSGESLEDMKERLFKAEIEAIYVIEPGFQERLRGGEYRGLIRAYYGESQVAARMLTESISGVVMDMALEEKGIQLLKEEFRSGNQEFEQEAEARDYLNELRQREAPQLIDIKNIDGGRPLGFREIFLTCLIYLTGAFCLLFAGGFMASEQEEGVLMRLASFGRRPGMYLFSGFISASVILWLAGLLAAWLAGGLSVRYALAAAGMYVFLSLAYPLLMRAVNSRPVFFIMSPILLISAGIIISGLILR